jgi:hypothetical protein
MGGSKDLAEQSQDWARYEAKRVAGTSDMQEHRARPFSREERIAGPSSLD